MCVSLFIACVGSVSYGVRPWILILPVIAEDDDNGHLAPRPPLVRYNEGLLYLHILMLLQSIFFAGIEISVSESVNSPSRNTMLDLLRGTVLSAPICYFQIRKTCMDYSDLFQLFFYYIVTC
jgi:hypothetical protein